MFYTYVLKSVKDNKLYTGYTNNLKERYKRHISAKVHSTKNRGGLKLIYFEACLHETDAVKRERYLKSGLGKRYLKQRLRYFDKNAGLGPLEV